jgi:leucyl/phenylalanyl-tRNA--protein transferase
MQRSRSPLPRVIFPDPETAEPGSGLLAVGADYRVAILREAYEHGIFPWPMAVGDLPIEASPPLWFCPGRRAILFFENLHVPRSLARVQRKSTLRFTIDQAFPQVISHCALQPRPGQDGTWITEKLKEAYIAFHRAGYAHSFEAWEGERLVAGLYGVDAGGAFAAESMFHLEPNASKLLVLEVIRTLQARGATWMDIQVLTPHMKVFGASEVTRKRYLKLLQETQNLERKLFSSS